MKNWAEEKKTVRLKRKGRNPRVVDVNRNVGS